MSRSASNSNPNSAVVRYEELSRSGGDSPRASTDKIAASAPSPSDQMQRQETGISIRSADTVDAAPTNQTKKYPWNSTIQYAMGIWRDIPWAIPTLLNYTFPFLMGLNTAGATIAWGAWITQLIAGFAGLAAAFGVFLAIDFAIAKYRKEDPVYCNKQGMYVLFTYALASLASILLWNLAQIWGLQLAAGLGLIDSAAGYFSSVLPGPMEAAVQYIITMTFMSLADKEVRQQCIDALKSGVKFLQEIISFVLGMFSGTVWQLVAQAGLDWMDATEGCDKANDPQSKECALPVYASSVALGLAVFITSFICTAIAKQINKQIDKCFGDTVAYEKLKTTAAPSNKNCCHRMFGGKKKPAEQIVVMTAIPAVNAAVISEAQSSQPRSTLAVAAV